MEPSLLPLCVGGFGKRSVNSPRFSFAELAAALADGDKTILASDPDEASLNLSSTSTDFRFR
jgi:hypothetical protein